MFGLGLQEVLLLLILGLLLFGVPIGAIILALFLVRRLSGAQVAELEAENRRLRERLDGERGRAEPGGAPDLGGRK